MTTDSGRTAPAVTHACYSNTDSRGCYELRYYGYSPVLRDATDHSEGSYMTVDPDGDCECDCHMEEDYEYDNC